MDCKFKTKMGQRIRANADMKRKQFTPIFKAQVVLEMRKETQTIAQLASTYGEHPTQLNHWKAQALKEWASVFERKDTTAELKAG